MGDTFKQRILVVDDEPSVRGSLAGLLNDAGYDVITAEHGFDALLQLRRAPPPTSSSPISTCRRCRDLSSSLSCAVAFLKFRWLRSAVLTSPAIASPVGSSPTHSTPRGSIIPKNSYALSPN